MLESLKSELAERKSVRFYVRVRPADPPTRIISEMDDGSVKVAVGAPPEKGKANAELVAFLADQFGVDMQNVFIKSGGTARMKLVMISS